MRLAALHGEFERWFAQSAPADHEKFDAYRRTRGEGMTNLQKSEALLAAAPHVGRFVGRLFQVEKELAALQAEVRVGDPLWQFKREFVKKRVVKADAGK